MTEKKNKDTLFCSFCGKNQKEVKKLIADPQKAITELNWKPKVDVDTGLKQTLQWIDDNFANLAREKLNYIHKK